MLGWVPTCVSVKLHPHILLCWSLVAMFCWGTRRGDDLRSPCPIAGLKVPEYPLCASCSEWGVIALLAGVHAGPCSVASPYPPWALSQALPHTASLTRPTTTTTELHPTPASLWPTHIIPQKLFLHPLPPALCSTFLRGHWLNLIP